MSDKEKSKDKPISASFEVPLSDFVAHVERLIDALRRGVVDIRLGERSARLTPNGQMHISLGALAKENKESLQLKLAWPIEGKVEASESADRDDLLATPEDLRAAFRSAFQRHEYGRAYEIGLMIAALYPNSAMAEQFRQIKDHLRGGES